MNYLDDLNTEQLKAVKQTEGPVRIIAGPGSGKTKTIISKIVHILKNDLAKPEEILVFTFTNKAANEIKERIQETKENVTNVYTYHSWATQFLRRESKKLNIVPDFKILDAWDQKKMVKDLMKQNNLETVDLKDALNEFSVYSANKEKLTEKNKGYYEEITKLYKLYINKKNQEGFFDFDDLLIKVRDFLQNHNEIIDIYKQKYKYIFVDEFQDTSQVQYDILKSMTSPTSSVTIVGDPDQNIYSWRNSDVKLMLNFNKDYPGTKTIILSKNYRSSKNIIDVSNKLINKNRERISFDVEPIKQDGDPIKIISGFNKDTEARKVADEILKLKREGFSFGDIAIIYRANYVSKSFETEFIRRNIPYNLIGGFKFFERSEVKAVLNFLHFLIKQDNFSLLNIINTPARGVGSKTVEELIKQSSKSVTTVWETLNNKNTKTSPRLKEFIDISNEFISRFVNTKKPIELLEEYLNEIGFLEYYNPDENKIENIYSVFEQLKSMLRISNSFSDLFDSISIYSSSDIRTKEEHVSLITVHASKGLEFKVVFVVGMNEGIMPSYRAQAQSELEEERRMAYVGITRAKDYLYLTYALGFNPITRLELEPSSFISDIEKQLNNYNYNEGNYIEVPEGYTSNNTDIIPGDVIYHKVFGEGKVLSLESKFFIAFFENGYNEKELMVGHPSYFKKI